MTAQPVGGHDADDPVEILRALPGEFREQFLAEYEAAVDSARRVEQYRRLHDMLRLWRLRAVAFSDPGYEARLRAVREAVRTGSLEGSVPAEEVIAGWAERE